MIRFLKKVIRRCLCVLRRILGNYVHLTVAKLEWNQALVGKNVLVVGGSDGIGLEIAKFFLSAGAKVVISGRSKEKLQVAQGACEGKIGTLQWDICDFNSADQKLREAQEECAGTINIIVNSAAFVCYRRRDEDYHDRMMETNFKAYYFLQKAEIEYLRRQNGTKKIINILSIHSFVTDSDEYTLTKKIMNEMTRGCANEEKRRHILINAIAPGWTNASINKVDYQKNAYDGRNGNGRIILTEEIANMALFLASDAANGITGQIIAVDGGASL